MTLDIQFKTMLAMMVAGFCLGITFESFRYFTPLWYRKIFLRYLLEILFWVSQTALAFWLLYQINNGELRFYIILAFFLGFSIYKAIFAALYQRILIRFIKIIKAVLSFIGRVFHLLILQPIFGIVSLLWGIILFFLRILFTPLFFLLSPVGKSLPNMGKKIQKVVPKPFLAILYKFSKVCGIIKNTLKKMKDYLTF